MDSNRVLIGFRVTLLSDFWIENVWKFILIFLAVSVGLLVMGNLIVFWQSRKSKARKEIEEFMKN